MSKPLSICQLYTFVDTAYLHGRKPEEVAGLLCDGGSDLIQLRAKNSSPAEIQQMAEAILPVTQAAGVGLVINDYIDVAQAVGADYCHLGQEDFMSLELGKEPILKHKFPGIPIGLSTHAPEQAEMAVRAGADYIGVGPVYRTATKPEAEAVTLEYVRWVAERVKIPWFAIGGINLENLHEVLEAGVCRVCVVSAVLNAKSVVKACQEFKRRLLSAPIVA